MFKSLSFIVALIALCSFQGINAQKRVEHVILIGVDGLGAYAFKNVKTPNIRNWMKQGSWTMQARSVLPSSSAPNWASMVMGVGPELHGYTTWGSQKPDLPSRELDEYGMFPNIYGTLRKNKPKSEIGVVYEWDGIGYLFPKKAVNYEQNCEGDSITSLTTVDYIKNKKPNFLFVHFGEVDHVGHSIGHATIEYYQSVEKLDEYIGEIINSIKMAGIADKTVIIFTADHGGINKGHGGITMEEMQIPWIISGPSIKKNHEINTSIMTFETAATIAKLLKLPQPHNWIGKPVYDAFSNAN